MTLLESQFKRCHGRPRRRRRRPARHDDIAQLCWLMEAAIAAAFGVPVVELQAPSRRTATVAFARQCAMYLAHVVLRLNYCRIGRLFQRDRTTAAHACQTVAKRRNDPAVDRLLQMLEEVCEELSRVVRRRLQVLR